MGLWWGKTRVGSTREEEAKKEQERRWRQADHLMRQRAFGLDIDFQQREKEADMMAVKALNEIDWNMMTKHLHTHESRNAFTQTCTKIHSDFLQVKRITSWQRFDPWHHFYYEELHPPVKEPKLLSWVKKFRMPIVISAGMGAVILYAATKFVAHKKEYTGTSGGQPASPR